MSAGHSLRVLLAGPADATRTLLLATLLTDPQLAVAGAAGGVAEIVEKARVLKPDLILLNIGPDGIDGVKATRRIMESQPVPIVIVTAAGRHSSVSGILDALSAGALVVLNLPPGGDAAALVAERRRTVATIRSLAAVRVIRRSHVPELPGVVPAAGSGLPVPPSRIRVVAIAASTGGPDALRRILAGLPGSFPVPILVVQHIAEGFSSGLVRWLNEAASLCVKSGEQGEALAPGFAYLAPDRLHLGVATNATVALSDTPAIGGFKPSATYLFESVAAAFSRSALAVILTGMGEDGLTGLRVLKSAGGYVLAQNEATSVVFGMPARAIDDGLVDEVVALDQISLQISRRVARG